MSNYYRSILNTLTVPFTNTKSILLDGVDDYVDCGNISEIKNNIEMTLSFWAKIEDTSRRILFGQNLVSGNDIFQLYYYFM